jgi:hypothetical protein
MIDLARSSIMSGAFACLLACTLVGCTPPPPQLITHDVVFSVTSDTGDPVPGVRLYRAGAVIGDTGKDGQIAARFRAPDGAQLIVHAQCPDGHVDPVEDTRVILRQLSAVAAGSGRRVTIQCRRTRVLAAVVVRAGIPDLPIVFEGEEITRTGANGIAHVSAAVPPHQTFSLTVDTSASERIRPKNPAATFTMASEDAFFVFDSALEKLPEPRKPPKRKRPKAKPPEGPPRPVLVPPNAHLGEGRRSR